MSSVKNTFQQLPWTWYAVSAVIVFFDLLTKKLVVDNFIEHERYNIFPFFDLTLRYNPGAAFSFLADQGGWQIIFFSALSAIVSLVLIVWIARLGTKNWWESLGLSLILGGALGNLYDRVTIEKVVDFILVYYQDHYYPAFNIADSAICIGAGILIFDAIFNHRKESK